MYHWIKKVVVVGFCLLIGFKLLAQTSTNSPYSRFGIGDPVSENFVASHSMGGLAAAFTDPYMTNLANPASLGNLQSTSFEIGFETKKSNYSSMSEKASFWGGSLNYFSLAFPVLNPINRVLDRKALDFNWGMSLSLLPLSRVNFSTSVDESLDGIGEALKEYKGSGGTNKVMWGNGFKYKDLYFGLKVGYLFGKINNERTIIFQDLMTPYHDYFRDDVSYRGFVWNAGLQYILELSPKEEKTDARFKKTITFGLYGNSVTSMNTYSNQFYARKGLFYSGLTDNFDASETDTLVHSTDFRESGKLPSQFGFGILLKNGQKWMAGFNVETAGWSKFENQTTLGKFSNTWTFSIGGEYTPEADSYRFYYKKIRYRAGLVVGKDPRIIENRENQDQLSKFGLNLGFGLPIVISRQASFINLGVEYGHLGGDVPIKENFVAFNVGVTLNNNLWFYKRKFN
jgi:hypothetical protein